MGGETQAGQWQPNPFLTSFGLTQSLSTRLDLASGPRDDFYAVFAPWFANVGEDASGVIWNGWVGRNLARIGLQALRQAQEKLVLSMRSRQCGQIHHTPVGTLGSSFT